VYPGLWRGTRSVVTSLTTAFRNISEHGYWSECRRHFCRFHYRIVYYKSCRHNVWIMWSVNQRLSKGSFTPYPVHCVAVPSCGAVLRRTMPRVASFTPDALPYALHCTAAPYGIVRRCTVPHPCERTLRDVGRCGERKEGLTERVFDVERCRRDGHTSPAGTCLSGCMSVCLSVCLCRFIAGRQRQLHVWCPWTARQLARWRHALYIYPRYVVMQYSDAGWCRPFILIIQYRPLSSAFSWIFLQGRTRDFGWVGGGAAFRFIDRKFVSASACTYRNLRTYLPTWVSTYTHIHCVLIKTGSHYKML